MSCSSGNSSGGSAAAPQAEDERKRKRMESNRDSARRSRMRKQKHVEDLTAQLERLAKEKAQIASSMNATHQSYMNVEAQNSVLRAQKTELTQRLQSLNDILCFMNTTTTTTNVGINDGFGETMNLMMDPWNMSFNNNTNNLYLMNQHQPIMASAEMFQYY